jgi:enoyl-CoA hydratase/carnithine racemase
MKSGLKVGDIGELTWTVDASMVITLGGDARASVFSTPNMIMLMERAAREALRPYLEPGEESVGVDVNIQHISGAAMGTTVNGAARVSSIDGRRIGFEVSQMTEDFECLIRWLLGHEDSIRVVLLTGAGRAFCAGDDVKELQHLSIETARTLSHRQAQMYLALERIPQPVIALVNGDAFGSGCVAAYSTDMRIATHSARFAMPEIKLGWPPGYGVAQLTSLIGKSRALEMCLLGEPVSAKQALEWGLINETVSSNALIVRGRQIAEKMLQLPVMALRATKRLVHLDEGAQPKVAHRADTEAYLRCLELPDAREGMAAFAEKRSPKFGR